jgi:hypothetical protein
MIVRAQTQSSLIPWLIRKLQKMKVVLVETRIKRIVEAWKKGLDEGWEARGAGTESENRVKGARKGPKKNQIWDGRKSKTIILEESKSYTYLMCIAMSGKELTNINTYYVE